MFQRVDFSAFTSAFRAHRREGQFSHDALRALFEHIEEVEEDTGEQIELDVIALCCDYQEASAEQIIRENGLDTAGYEDEEGMAHMVEEFLRSRTTLIWREGDRFLYHAF